MELEWKIRDINHPFANRFTPPSIHDLFREALVKESWVPIYFRAEREDGRCEFLTIERGERRIYVHTEEQIYIVYYGEGEG